MVDIALPAQLPVPAGALALWTIYDHPRDFPGGYVLRASLVASGQVAMSPIAWYADDPDKLRAIIPPGLVCIGRQPEDHATVLEVWV